MKKRYFIFLGIILIVLAIYSANLFSAPIDHINISFEKDYYSTTYDSSLKINYTLENNNPEKQDILVYAVCDEDVLTCNFSRTFNILENSSIQSSFTIKSIDDGSSNLRFYVKDIKTNELRDFILRIDVDRYTDDGKFEVDLSKTSFCQNRVEETYLVFDRVFTNDFYNLSLSSNTLFANIKGQTNRYLTRDTEIPLQIDTRNVSEGNHKITLNISNNELFSTKTFNVYVSKCPDLVVNDFTVTGLSQTTHILKKEEPLSLTFIVKNISLKNKHIFISQESDNILDINFSNRELKLSPNESREVTLTFTAPKEIHSGDYSVKLSFFDEKTTITRNLKFLVQPESNLNIRLLQSAVVLEIGKNFNIGVVIENKGDVLETIYFESILSNDLRINNMVDSVTVSPRSNKTVLLNLSAGPNTKETTSQIQLLVRNSDNQYSKSFILEVISFRSKELFKISFLSFPNEISVDLNSSKEFSFEIYNSDDKDIVISKINIFGLPQEITYELSQYINIPSKSSRIVTGKFTVGDLALQELNINVIFYSNTGSVISKPILLKVTDTLVEYDDEEDKKFPITGFFTLSTSILLGIIFLSLLLIILFSTGVIRTKHKSYIRN
jgi:uncharacterized membrane protein